MDPNELWGLIVAGIANQDGETDRAELAQQLRDLADWIEKGGFLPNVLS